MRIVTVPASVKVALASRKDMEKTEVTFKDFLTMHLDGYTAVKTPSQVRQVVKIMDVIDAAAETMAFEDADFEVVKGSLNEGKYVPGIARQLISFFDAIDKPDEVKK